MRDPEIIIISIIGDIEDWMAVKCGRVCSGCRPAMPTKSPGNIASANYFYLRSLYMNYCALQHIQSPLWPLMKLSIEKCLGFTSAFMQAFMPMSTNYGLNPWI